MRVGIGLNTGRCHIGKMCSQQRFSYSALGRPVDVAARLEALTKEAGFPILTGPKTAEGAPELAWLELDPVVTRGSRDATGLRTLLGDAALAASPGFAGLVEAQTALRAARARGSNEHSAGALELLDARLEELEGAALVRSFRMATTDPGRTPNERCQTDRAARRPPGRGGWAQMRRPDCLSNRCTCSSLGARFKTSFGLSG